MFKHHEHEINDLNKDIIVAQFPLDLHAQASPGLICQLWNINMPQKICKTVRERYLHTAGKTTWDILFNPVHLIAYSDWSVLGFGPCLAMPSILAPLTQ